MCVCISTTAQRNENADNRANDDCGAAKPKEIIAAFAAFAASRRCGFQSRDSIFLWGQELLRRGSPWSLDYLFLLGVAPRVHRRPRLAHGQWQWSILNADTTCTSLARCGAVQQQRRGAASVASAFGSDAQNLARRAGGAAKADRDRQAGAGVGRNLFCPLSREPRTLCLGMT
jgi:hypothetical protein